MIFERCPLCVAEESGNAHNQSHRRSRSASRESSPDTYHRALRARSGSVGARSRDRTPDLSYHASRARSGSIGALSRSESVGHGNNRSVVSSMPYITPWGEFGWYSGEVDDYGCPNGEGRMCFKSGQQYSGLWISGLMQDKSRMMRGFDSYV